MATQRYRYVRFSDKSLELIATMNAIIADYSAQGFILTVRQLYYQLVAANVIPNTELSYKRTTSVANDARMAGLMDWDAIEDRTRAFLRRQRWKDGAELLNAAADSFHIDMWQRQVSRVFCIIEKEALVGVLEPTCRKWDVPILAARGYPSSTVLREFAISDLLPYIGSHDIIVLHLGDHDPSGIDMTRDLKERIDLFCGKRIQLKRIALTMDQVNERQPPPNPAKVTDSRFKEYSEVYGDESWELDALPPQYLADLMEAEISRQVEPEQWKADTRRIEKTRKKIQKIADDFV